MRVWKIGVAMVMLLMGCAGTYRPRCQSACLEIAGFLKQETAELRREAKANRAELYRLKRSQGRLDRADDTQARTADQLAREKEKTARLKKLLQAEKSRAALAITNWKQSIAPRCVAASKQNGTQPNPQSKSRDAGSSLPVLERFINWILR